MKTRECYERHSGNCNHEESGTRWTEPGDAWSNCGGHSGMRTAGCQCAAFPGHMCAGHAWCICGRPAEEDLKRIEQAKVGR